MEYLLSGHSLALDEALCNGCGRCVEVCPHAVFAITARKAAIVNRGHCMECGACRMNCPLDAIAVSSGVGCAAAIINSLRHKGDGAAAPCSCG
jgi:ferredoxin